jgi:hypothetical protein
VAACQRIPRAVHRRIHSLLLVALAAYPTILASSIRPALLLLGMVAAALLTVAVAARRTTLAGWAVATLVAAYALALVARDGPLDPAAPLIGSRRHRAHRLAHLVTGTVRILGVAGLAAAILAAAESIPTLGSRGLRPAPPRCPAPAGAGHGRRRRRPGR